MSNLCESLKHLATDGSKHRAKKDRRQQRSTFRDVLRSIEVKIFFFFFLMDGFSVPMMEKFAHCA